MNPMTAVASMLVIPIFTAVAVLLWPLFQALPL